MRPVRNFLGGRRLNKRIWEKLASDDLDRVESKTSPVNNQRDESKIAKRSRLERYIDILGALNKFGPLRRTHILYKANLAWSDLEDALTRLEDVAALRKVVGASGVFYEITDSGKRFLNNFVAVKESLEPELLTREPIHRKVDF
jgi:predicted transcriptional regulator